MKHQQVVVDYWAMVKTSLLCVFLAMSGFVLLKMVQTIFWLPRYLQDNQNRLEEFAKKYNEANKEQEGNVLPQKGSDIKKKSTEDANDTKSPLQEPDVEEIKKDL